MDFSVAYIFVLSNRILLNDRNKRYYERYYKQFLKEALIKRIKTKRNQMIDLDKYQPMSLSEKIKRKQKRHIKKDYINKKICEMMLLNRRREFYKRRIEMPRWFVITYEEYFLGIEPDPEKYKQKNIELYNKFNEKFNYYIIDMLLLSRNIQLERKRINEKLIKFKIRCIDKLIDYIYIPNERTNHI